MTAKACAGESPGPRGSGRSACLASQPAAGLAYPFKVAAPISSTRASHPLPDNSYFRIAKTATNLELLVSDMPNLSAVRKGLNVRVRRGGLNPRQSPLF